MKYLITGIQGQLGQEWFHFLNKRQENVVGFNKDQFDITDIHQVRSVLDDVRPDILINCAAYTNVDGAEDEPDVAYEVNEAGVINLARECHKRNVKLVHFSTDYIFPGREEDRLQYPEGYVETHQTAPLNVYGASKLAGEKGLAESGVSNLVIRISWLCGQYGDNFVKTMIHLAKTRDQLHVVDDQVGSPTFTANVVANTYNLITRRCEGIYHVTSKGIITWYQISEIIFKHLGYKVELIPVSTSQFSSKATRPAFSKLNTRKVESIEGIRIEEWKTGLISLLDDLGL